MQKLTIALLVIALPTSASAEIYKWKDKDGRVHFGDSASGSAPAEKVQLKINTYTHVTYAKRPRVAGPAHSANAGSVVLYGTRWCGYCKKAKAYFNARNISYVDYDIETDATALAQFKGFGGGGVPVIFVGDTRINGFNEAAFERVYRKP